MKRGSKKKGNVILSLMSCMDCQDIVKRGWIHLKYLKEEDDDKTRQKKLQERMISVST